MSKRAAPFVNALAKMAEKFSERMPEGDDPASKLTRTVGAQLQAHVSRLARRAQALQRMEETRNPLETQAAHEKRIAKAAAQLEAEAEAMLDSANETLRNSVGEIEKLINSKVNFVPNEYAQEVRSTFRALEYKDRLTMISKMVDGNQGPELAAILQAPEFLAGLNKEQQGNFTEMLFNRHASVERDARDAIMTGFGDTLTAVRTARNAAKLLTDPGRMADIEAGERAAAEAQAAFEGSADE